MIMEQINMFEVMNEPIQFKNKNVYLVEFFGGIGSQLKALKNIGCNIVDHNLIEVDINATISNASIHQGLNEKKKHFHFPSKEEMVTELEPYGWWSNEKLKDINKLKLSKLQDLYLAQKLTNNLGNVYNLDIEFLNKKIKEHRKLGHLVIITWSSPCQDFSLAGKLAGFSGGKGNLTQVTLDIFEQLETKPDVLLFENVPNIMSLTFKSGFDEMRNRLIRIGYDNITMKLNAKNYGIPQNRNRVFILSIRKDLMQNKYYKELKPFELKLRLKDMLENEVDEKYYLSKEILENLELSKYECLKPSRKIKETAKGICTSLTTMQGGHRQPFIKVPEATKQGYAIAEDGDGIYIDRPHQKRGVVQKGMIPTLKTSGNDLGVVTVGNASINKKSQAGKIYSKDGLSPTLCAGTHGYAMGNIQDNLRIRKLTPLECFRLMGFDDIDYENAKLNVSESALYKQCGNSIVVDVLENIFENLF